MGALSLTLWPITVRFPAPPPVNINLSRRVVYGCVTTAGRSIRSVIVDTDTALSVNGVDDVSVIVDTDTGYQ